MEEPSSESGETIDDDDVSSGGKPEALGRCTECGGVYPVQTKADGHLRPIGTGGSCECGNTEFELLSYA